MIQATAPGAPLDREAPTFPPRGVSGRKPDRRELQKGVRDPARRAAKYDLRRVAGRLLPDEGVAYCGRFVRWRGDEGEGWAQLKLGDTGASWHGLISCGSVWHCPVCAAKIAGQRREEVRQAIDRAQAAGLAIYMVTFTMPHHRFNDCAELVDAVANSFRKVQAGAPWQRAKERAGFEGAIRSLELTHGDNGWHPHLHCLFMIKGGAGAADRAADLARFLFTRWSANIAALGFGECDEQAWQFEACENGDAAGEYVSKWGPDWELTHGHIKEGKRGGRSPWRILKDYTDAGEKRDAALFIDYATTLKGRRQLTWTKGLKARFNIGEAEDKELADRPEDDAARTVVELHGDAVIQLAAIRGGLSRTLEVLETGGVDALLKFLNLCNVSPGAIRVVEFPLSPPDGYERVKTMLGAAVARKVFGVVHV